MAAIGIDYGTSNSEVAFFDGEEHHFITLDPQQAASNKIRSSVFIYYDDELPMPPASAVEALVGVPADCLELGHLPRQDGFSGALLCPTTHPCHHSLN